MDGGDGFDHRLDAQFARLRDITMAHRPDMRDEFDACLPPRYRPCMSDDIDYQQQESPHRLMHVTAAGDNLAELEMDALDKARAFFGAGLRLAIVPDYQVCSMTALDALAGTGKKYVAGMRVRVIEP